MCTIFIGCTLEKKNKEIIQSFFFFQQYKFYFLLTFILLTFFVFQNKMEFNGKEYVKN